MNTTCGWVTMLAVLAGCGGGDDSSDRDVVSDRSQQCARVRDHLVGLRLATSHGLSKDELEQHRTALARAFDASFLETCERTATEGSLDCVLGATDSQAAAACLAAPSGN